MKKYNFWFFAIACCLLPIAFALVLSLFVRRLPDVGQPHENTQVWIYTGHPVTHTFTPQNNGLNVITVYMKNVSIRNKDPLKFELSDSSVPIREINLSGYNIGDGDNVRFQFAPILDSKNKQYTFTLSNNSAEGLAVGVGYSDQAKSISYQTYYYPTSRLQVLLSTLDHFFTLLTNFRFLLLFIIITVCITLPLRIIFVRFV